MSSMIFHYWRPDHTGFLCDADQGFTTTYAPNVTCPECLEWMHA